MTPSTSTLQILSELIAFETVTRRSNLHLIDWAEARLQRLGARVIRDFNDASMGSLGAATPSAPRSATVVSTAVAPAT
jgi:acetylornithine deacetylase